MKATRHLAARSKDCHSMRGGEPLRRVHEDLAFPPCVTTGGGGLTPALPQLLRARERLRVVVSGPTAIKPNGRRGPLKWSSPFGGCGKLCYDGLSPKKLSELWRLRDPALPLNARSPACPKIKTTRSLNATPQVSDIRSFCHNRGRLFVVAVS